MIKKQRVALLLTVIGVLLISSVARANPLVLPPRPTPPPTVSPSDGAQIELRVPANRLNYFTRVQWQMSNGTWQTIPSWEGDLDGFLSSGGTTLAYKRWWVLPVNFGERHFRWQVYDRPGGKLLAASATFDLPTAIKQDVINSVTLP